ncbi:MAG: SEL1-like repeat protein [Muribaculaceae bacterium]|nr:SEL1-like repeat protein [Muribaculaceae bacterium]
MAEKKKYEQALPVGFKLTGGSHDYYIEQILGQGGFGITYKVKTRLKAGNIGIDAHFAVKEYFPSGCWRNPGNTMMLYAPTSETDVKSSLKDFITEGRRLQQICNINNNIVSVNEVFEANGTAYFVMEFLSGGDIRQWVRDNGGAMTEEEMMSIITPIANAVQCLHDHNMLHLDIKPENIVMRLSEDGSHLVPVLIDFGIAVHFDEKGSPTTTSPSKGVTQGYSPVEQFAGITRFDPRFDVYSLSATCFYMLTGQDPKSAFDVTKSDIRASLKGHASKGTIDAIVNGMCKDVVHRTPTVNDLLNALVIAAPKDESSDDDKQETRSLNYLQSDIPVAALNSSGDASLPVSEPYETTDDEQTKSKKRKIWIIALCVAALLGLGIWGASSLIKGGGITKGGRITKDETEDETQLEKLLKDTIYSEALLKEAQRGNAEAQNLLGICYDRGNGVERDINQALEWYRKAAEQGYARAQFNLGNCYFYGEGVEKDLKQSAVWYRKAAEQGDAIAQCCLGGYYYNGWGVEIDYKQAVEWFRKAAEQGNADAQYNLGQCYNEGHGVIKDINQAVEWYRKAAEQGIAEAQYSLGCSYYSGQGVEIDYNQAVEWFRKAAEQGVALAQYNLGWCYYNGIGVEKNLKQAVEWYRKAAEQGYADAQYSLGYSYYNGQGVEIDYNQAVEWFRKAAEQGNADAQCYLGYCYDEGHGVIKDINQAILWYQKAARQGNVYAQQNLQNLGESW